jgi:hypothetical protein
MRLLLSFIICLYLYFPSFGQERVRNIRLRALDSANLEIRYDLVNARPGDSIYFDVRSRVRGSLQILPQFVRGDVGMRVVAGSDRRIIWNALGNGYPLNEEIQAIVRVKTGVTLTNTIASSPTPSQPNTESDKPIRTESPQQTQPPVTNPYTPPTSTTPVDPAPPFRDRYAGPAWALLSAVAPGVGNIFVQQPGPKIGLRPFIAVGCYGLLAYGIIERGKAQDALAIYEQQKNATAAEPYYATANQHHHRYYLATRGALVVAAADVVLTFLRGLRNNQLKKEARRLQSVTVSPSLQSGQPTAVFRYSF